MRNTAFICALGAVFGAFVFELGVGDGEGVFDVLVFSPLLALDGGLFGVFMGGWVAACREAWEEHGAADGTISENAAVPIPEEPSNPVDDPVPND